MTTLRELGATVRSRKIGARELVARSLQRIEALDPDLGAVVALRADEALDDAHGLDEWLAEGHEAGPLAGLPLLVKDMTDVAGMRTTFGSLTHRVAPAATTDAVVVARLRAAGAIVVGKTNLPEFAAEGFTSNLLFGPTRNPWNRERTCGGSSGGSAVALAAGMAAIATATDGGGSIRIPAGYCGLVGLKPTNGVIGRDPIPDWIDLSTDGPFSTRADDLALLLDVLRGPTPGDPSAQQAPFEQQPSAGRVLAIDRFTEFGSLPPEVAEPFERAVASFADAFDVEIQAVTPRDLFGTARIDDDWYTLTGAEHVFLFGRAWFDEHVEELTPSIRSFFGDGLRVTIEEYLAARRRRFGYVRALDDLLGDNGLLLSPVMAADACAAEGWDEGSGGPEVYACAAQNITGHPALSLPAGAYPSGVPFGLQVTGPRFRDDLLLDVARRWEEAVPWPRVAPGYEPFA
jgi:Asp-tRNA(Asn)/Glu-tRNA(Gln) amidotransferase A subunit family amidase